MPQSFRLQNYQFCSSLRFARLEIPELKWEEELALIDKSPRSATAVAKTDCSLIPITEKQFLFLVQETPFFALTVMATLARRIRSRNAQFGVMPVSAKADAE